MSWRTRGCIALAAIGAALVAPAAAQTVVYEDFKLISSDGTASDEFGHSVAVSGNRAIIGAIGDDDRGAGAGAAYIFRFDGTSWVEEAKLTASDAGANDYFGYSVSISGDAAIVGAPYDNFYFGSAYLFRFDGQSWSEEAKLTASDGETADYFGISVAISGDTAVIGAFGHDGAFGDTGSAYVFRRHGTDWSQEAKLFAVDGAAGDIFGRSVSISGDTAVIGADNHDGAYSNSGSAYVFRRDGTMWSQEATLTAADGTAGDLFGYSVSVSGAAAIIGAVGDNNRSGAAYIFRRNGSTWIEEVKLIASDDAPYEYFGSSVSICGDIAAVGAHGDDAWGDFAGAAYIFGFDGKAWSERAKLVASDGAAGDNAGRSVAVCESAVIGSWYDDDNGQNSGSAYIFNLATDSDRDGLADADEVSRYGTDPYDPDSDDDGANDYTEVVDSVCLDPWNPDTDGDTLPDGAEIDAGTNACDPDSDGDGIEDAVDDLPLVPGVSSGQLEEMTRTLGGLIQLTDLSLFNAPNDNANKGRRNALANRAVSAGNAIAAGDTLAAADALESLIAKVDGVEPEPDWMDDSPEKDQLEADATLLLALLTM